MKKIGKTNRPFRYDLNQIPYDNIVEVTIRFKRLDLINRVPDELWREVPDIVQATGIKTIPMENKCKKAKWLSEIQPVHSKGDQPWDFFGRNDAKAEVPVLWPPHAKS